MDFVVPIDYSYTPTFHFSSFMTRPSMIACIRGNEQKESIPSITRSVEYLPVNQISS